MNSRASILGKIKANQPELIKLIEIPDFEIHNEDLVEKFTKVLTSIGGFVMEAKNYSEIEKYISDNYDTSKRVIWNIDEIKNIENKLWLTSAGVALADVDLAVLQGKFGVAENGAIWITENELGIRASAFITQYLILAVNKKDIVANMHKAYEITEHEDYGFGTFIAGPSKTADIEQALVIGAHGARGLVVFLMDK